MPQARDEMGRFVAATDEAAERLRGFSREVDAAGNAARSNNEQSSLRTALQVGGGAALGGLAASSRGIGVAQATGDFSDGVNASIYGAVSALGRVPGIGNLLGATQAGNVLDRAGGRVSDVTGDLARYGINVSDEFRNGLVNTSVEQERRVETERQAVMGALGDPEVIGKAGAKGTAVEGFAAFAEEIREGVRILTEIWNKLSSITGGSS